MQAYFTPLTNGHGALGHSLSLQPTHCCSVSKSCLTLCSHIDCSTPGLPLLHYLPEFAQTHIHWFGDAFQPAHLLLPLLLLPSFFPNIRVFSSKSTLCIKWPKYWSFSFNISPSNEYSGVISFRMDWFDLLGVQGTLKSLLQHHNLKISVLWQSAFTVQLSHPYMTTGKTIALTIQIKGYSPLLAKWYLGFLIHCLGLS